MAPDLNWPELDWIVHGDIYHLCAGHIYIGSIYLDGQKYAARLMTTPEGEIIDRTETIIDAKLILLKAVWKHRKL